MSFIYEAYAHYSNGFLLEEGAILDQNPKLMKCLATMSNQMVLCDQEKRETDRQREEHRRRAAELVTERDGGR